MQVTLQMATSAEVVTVPNADDMDDETFLKHMDKRHTRQGFHFSTKHITDDQIELWRKYHDRLHEIAVPGQFDHEHLR